MKTIDKRLYWAATPAYMSFIAYMSLIRLGTPGEPASIAKQIFDNFLHVPGYALLAFLLIHCFKGISKKTLLFAALITIGYGILMEYFQSLTAYRSASFMDVCSNTLGTGIVVIFYFMRHPERSEKTSS